MTHALLLARKPSPSGGLKPTIAPQGAMNLRAVEVAREWHTARVRAGVERIDSPATRDLKASLGLA